MLTFIKKGSVELYMKKLDGIQEAFKTSKQVFLKTMTSEGESHMRPMTNFNESPYEEMWFPSFKDTRKIREIESNHEVVVSFPSSEEGKWYHVVGEARLASWEEVREMWRWWLLEWLPEEDQKPLRYDDPFLDRSIILVEPREASMKDHK